MYASLAPKLHSLSPQCSDHCGYKLLISVSWTAAGAGVHWFGAGCSSGPLTLLQWLELRCGQWGSSAPSNADKAWLGLILTPLSFSFPALVTVGALYCTLPEVPYLPALQKTDWKTTAVHHPKQQQKKKVQGNLDMRLCCASNAI